jgi:hypothetical protein
MSEASVGIRLPEMKCFAAIVMFVALAANWVPPTREQVEEDARRFLARCNAEHLLSVTVESPEVFKIKPLKKPEQRTEADLAALRCVGRQYSSLIDFRPFAQAMLTMQSSS